MFRPNTHGFLYRKEAQRNKFGKETFVAPSRIPLAVIRANRDVESTSVRAASRGAAEQKEATIMLLLPKTIKTVEGDVIRFLDRFMEITGIHPRIDVCGQLDHYELTGDIRDELNVDG